MILVKVGRFLLLVSFLIYAGCSAESGGDENSRQSATSRKDASSRRERVTVPALVDWDRRHYDVGQMSDPRRVGGGWIVQWDRYGLPMGEADPDSFRDDPVEPFGYIANLSDYPFTNENPRLRELSITPAAWLFVGAEDLKVCPGQEFEGDPPWPWRQGNLEAWIEESQQGAVVLLTYDMMGRVAQIREMVGC